MSNNKDLLNTMRSSMLGGIGTNIYRLFLEAIDSSLCSDAFPDGELYIRHQGNKNLMVKHILEWYYEKGLPVYEYEEPNGNKYVRLLLPLTNKPVCFPGSALFLENRGSNTYKNHKKNIESIEYSIDKVFGKELYEKYPEYAPKVDSNCPSFKLF